MIILSARVCRADKRACLLKNSEALQSHRAMIQVDNISKAFGSQQLFVNASFSVGRGERIGLVGRNGHGKSTLLKIIAGVEHADSGELHIPKDYRIGYLSQRLDFSAPTVLEEGAKGLSEKEGGWLETYRLEAVLQGLGFSPEQLSVSPQKLSGGFQVRLQLAKLLVSHPDLLLLDEPSNYLDIVSLRWLTRFLVSWPGELILVTHDRGFMDKIITHTVGVHRLGVRKIPGKTGNYYEQISLEEEFHEKTRVNQEKKRAQAEEFIDRFRAKASKARAVQSRVKALGRMEELEKLQDISSLHFSFSYAPTQSKWLLKVDNVSFGYTEERLIESIRLSIGSHDRIGVIGKNGRGKTTLLNLIAGELKPDSGAISAGANLALGYFGQTNVDRLHPELTVEQEVQSVNPSLTRTAVRNICGAMMFEGDLAEKRIEVLSGGERARVLLGKVLATPANLLLLDEPTNHLDMESTEALTHAIEEFPGAIVLVAHSEDMLHRTVNKLVVFDGGRATVFDGTYDDFLARVGWKEEEEQGRQRSEESAPAMNKKERRKRRAEIVQRRSEVLRPLQSKVTGLEERILKLEQEIARQTDELIEISRDGYGDDAAKLARQLHQNKSAVEGAYEELTAVSAELEEQGKEFEQQLSELAD